MYLPRSSSLNRASNSTSSGFRPMLRAALHTDAAGSLASGFVCACALTSPRPSRSPPQHPTPPGPPYALLSPSSSGPGLCPIRRLLGPLRRFSWLPASEQLPTQLVALPFGLFASPALLGHPLVQRGLRHLAAGPLGAELFPDLSPLIGRSRALGGLSCLLRGLQLRRDPLQGSG